MSGQRNIGFSALNYAGMTELVDVPDLGSCVARRWGSSPHTRIQSQPALKREGWLLF